MASRKSQAPERSVQSKAPSIAPLAAVVHFRTDGFTAAHWHGIGIVVWARAATPELVHHLDSLPEVIAMGGQYGTGSHINIVVEGTAPPTPEGRLALKHVSERHSANLVCLATLIEGTGFRASAIRSLITALQLFLRRGLQSRTFADLESLAEWLVPIHSRAVGEELAASQLVAVLRLLLHEQAALKAR